MVVDERCGRWNKRVVRTFHSTPHIWGGLEASKAVYRSTGTPFRVLVDGQRVSRRVIVVNASVEVLDG